MNVPRKYGLLRAVAFILKLLAWLVLALGIVGAIIILTALGNVLPQSLNLPAGIAGLGSASVLLICVVWFVQLFAFGSILSLLIDIEENTRALASEPPA